MKSGPKLWNKAKKIIPGGSMLFSKRQELLLPGLWPSYYSKAKDCYVWDLNNQKYNDMFNGVGTNILGYANSKIDNEVIKSIKNSNMSSLNSPYEVYLAEKLVQMHPWFHMVRFARSGGEANSIAIRIARAASGKDCVAVCGYHGWHDWYLAANIDNDDNLNSHLLKNLSHDGVPKNLKGSVKPFEYNNYEQLLDIVSKFDVGVIKMEVVRNFGPTNDFLQKVRNLATKKNIVLIFDECTSGFRESFGGIHKNYGVYPDIAMFGKAIGNGYAISAVVGKKEVMESAQNTFISSTFWTEQIGSVAALKTIEIMEATESWKKITITGEKIKKKWLEISELHNVKINISGISPLPSFIFDGDNKNILKTFFTQEMLKNKILASNVVFVSTKHNKKILDNYFDVFEKIFKKIKKISSHKKISKLLKNEICHQTFKRLN